MAERCPVSSAGMGEQWDSGESGMACVALGHLGHPGLKKGRRRREEGVQSEGAQTVRGWTTGKDIDCSQREGT